MAEAGSSSPAPGRPPPAATAQSEPDIAPHDIDYLLTQAERALQSVNAVGEGGLPPGVSSYRLEEFSGSPDATETATLDLVATWSST